MCLKIMCVFTGPHKRSPVRKRESPDQLPHGQQTPHRLGREWGLPAAAGGAQSLTRPPPPPPPPPESSVRLRQPPPTFFVGFFFFFTCCSNAQQHYRHSITPRDCTRLHLSKESKTSKKKKEEKLSPVSLQNHPITAVPLLLAVPPPPPPLPPATSGTSLHTEEHCCNFPTA